MRPLRGGGRVLVIWIGAFLLTAATARADDPLSLQDGAQPNSDPAVCALDTLGHGDATWWGPWPARADSNTALLPERPMPLWEKTILVPHTLIGLPFRFVHWTTETTITAIDDLGWFEVPPIGPLGFELPGRIFLMPSVSISGLEGVTTGLALTRPDLGGPENLLYLKASTSTRNAESLVGGTYFRLTDRSDLQLGGGFAEMSKMMYYGLGPDSDDDDRSYYERDSWWGGAETDIDLGRNIRTDLAAFFSRVEVAASEEEPADGMLTVHEGRLPVGFPGESSGWTGRVGLFRDTTDQTGRPARGCFHRVSLSYFHASDGSDVRYLRGHGDIEHFLPLGGWRTLGLRGFFNRIENTGDVPVPFSRMVTYSRPDELRGYRSMRFYGMGSLGLSAEYRWPVWVRHRHGAMGVDAYLFCDTGQVFEDKNEIKLPNFEITSGFGFRLIGDEGGFMGLLELGFSEEETIVSLRFGQNFQHDRRGLLYGKDPTRKR